MLAAVRRGDRVVTGGGIIGTVTKVIDDNEVQVEIAEGVRVRVQRPMISGVLAKTEPAPAGAGRGAATAGGSATPADDEPTASGVRRDADPRRQARLIATSRAADAPLRALEGHPRSCAVCVLGALAARRTCCRARAGGRAAVWLPHRQISLGLDLQGGSHLLLRGRYRGGGPRAAGGHGRRPSATSCARRASATRTSASTAARVAVTIPDSGAGRRRRRSCCAGSTRTRRSRAGDGGRLRLRPDRAGDPAARVGGGRAVAGDRPPPHRRDRRARAEHPAPGQRPHPGAAAGRRRSAADQGADRQDGEDDLPPGRRRRQPRRGAGRPAAAGLDGAAAARTASAAGPAAAQLVVQQARDGQRREPDRRPADLPAGRAGGLLPLRLPSAASASATPPARTSASAGHRARQPGDQRAARSASRSSAARA